MTKDHFMYAQDGAVWADTSRTHVGCMPLGIADMEQLLSAVATELDFPLDGPGDLWEAFDQHLTDLSWIQQPWVMLHHAELPDVPPEILAIYIDILEGASRRAREGQPRFMAVFPSNVRAKLSAVRTEWL